MSRREMENTGCVIARSVFCDAAIWNLLTY